MGCVKSKPGQVLENNKKAPQPADAVKETPVVVKE